MSGVLTKKQIEWIKERRWRILVTAVSFCLLLCMYGVIWGFSEQDGDTSSSLSLRISEGLVRFFDAVARRHWTEDIRKGWALYFEHPVRKLAHFGEYAVMGILIFGIWRPWVAAERFFTKKAEEDTPSGGGRKKKHLTRFGVRCLITVLWVFCSAASDEIHQTFIDGRDGNFADVLLDTCGGTFGLWFSVTVTRLFERAGKKRRKKSAEAKR